jgi:two-component system, response regulator, stage 0 sporulation protein F
MGSAAGLGRLLIVDDELSVREVLGEYFSEQGYAVETAGDGDEALASVRRSAPDLVLLDMRMPGIDGVETLRRIRALAGDVVVIMVTANEDVALARETLKLGALDYVAKPFDFAYLERAVMAGLAQGRAGAAAVATPPASDDPWHDLAYAVFQAARGMSAIGRASTGERLEAAVLAVVREAASGQRDAAAATLAQMGLLLGLAGDLRDVTSAELARVEEAMERARRVLGGGGR